MKKLDDPIAAAAAEVERIFAAEHELSRRRDTLTAALPELRADAGAAALATALDGAEPPAVDAVTTLTAQIDATDYALTAARTRRLEAVRALWQAGARQLREQAATLRREADERQKRTDELLAALAEHEGVSYAPAQPIAPPPGTCVSPVTIWTAAPKTALLRLEADGLDGQAAALESRQPVAAGSVSGESAGALLAQLHQDPLRLDPLPHEVTAWVQTAVARELASARRHNPRLATFVPATSPNRLDLVWSGGQINAARSRVEPIPPAPDISAWPSHSFEAVAAGL